MFCGKCGTQNPDNAAFCKKCGTQLNVQKKVSASTTAQTPVRVRPQPQQRRPAQKKNRRQDKKVGMIAVAFIAVIVLIVAFALFGGRSYKTTVKQFITATYDVDAEKLIKVLPDAVIDRVMKDEDYEDYDEMIDDLNDTFESQMRSIKRYIGDDWSMSYKIIKVEKVSGKDLDELKKDYKKDFKIKVSAAKVAEVEITIKAGETENSSSLDIPLVKVGRSWYIDAPSLGGLF